MAGLFCFQSLGFSAELPPARSAAPAPQATPEVRSADLKALRDEQSAALQGQADKVEEQARRLSRTAAVVDDLQAELRTEVQANKTLDASVAGLNAGIAALDKRVSFLRDASATRDMQDAALVAQVQGLGDEVGAMKLAQDSAGRQTKEGLADIAALREDLKQRQAKLDSLTDLLSVIKKDVDSNSEEIVEVKQSLKLYDPVKPASVDGDGEWWDQALRWKYLPAVAVGLSAIAVGVTATR